MAKSLRTLIILGLLIGAGTSTNAQAAEVTLRLHHFTPPVAAMHRMFLVPWTKRVKEQSGGRPLVERDVSAVVIDFFPEIPFWRMPRDPTEPPD